MNYFPQSSRNAAATARRYLANARLTDRPVVTSPSSTDERRRGRFIAIVAPAGADLGRWRVVVGALPWASVAVTEQESAYSGTTTFYVRPNHKTD